MFRYLSAAFFVRPHIPGLGRMPVNVLAVASLGILGFGNPGFWLLGLGLEAAFLTALATHPRFQRLVRAESESRGEVDAAPSGRRLPPSSRRLSSAG